MSQNYPWIKRALLLAPLLLAAGCSVEVLQDLPEQQANAVVVALKRHGIVGRKQRQQGAGARYSVQVKRGSALAAWQAMQREGLPRPRTAGLKELLGPAGALAPSSHHRAMMSRGLAGELAATLQSDTEYVLSAHVGNPFYNESNKTADYRIELLAAYFVVVAQ